jgi:DNA primase
VFLYGKDGAELRGTGAVQWRGVYGTMTQAFALKSKACTKIAVCESAIDAMSYRQLNPDCMVVAIAGNSNQGLMAQIVEFARVKDIPVIAAFDNDKGGEPAYLSIGGIASAQGVTVIRHRPVGKDFNDDLLTQKQEY